METGLTKGEQRVSDHLAQAFNEFCKLELSWRERLKLLLTGNLYLQQLAFHRPLQPQLPSVDKPELVRQPPNRQEMCECGRTVVECEARLKRLSE